MKITQALELIKKHTGIVGLTEVPLEKIEFIDTDILTYSIDSENNIIALSLVGRELKDVSFLASFQTLIYLNLAHNDITDISVLATFKELESLYVFSNQITDISSLANLKKLVAIEFDLNLISDFPYFLKDFPYLKRIAFLPNPYKIKNIEYLSFIFNEINDTNVDFDQGLLLFKQIATTVEKQVLEQENWINLRVPKLFERAVSQYLSLFKDFVSVVKGKIIDFYLKKDTEGLVLISNGETNISKNEILHYLEEYIGLLSQDLKNTPLQVENRDLDSEKLRREIDLFILRHESQMNGLRTEMRVLEMENQELRQEVEHMKQVLGEQEKRLVLFEHRLKLALEVPKQDQKMTVFCEGENAKLLSNVGFDQIDFLGEIDKSSVLMRLENNSTVYGIIDRDLLTDEEKQTLEKRFPNLIILEYYCFENYLLHPENLKEIAPNFDTKAYIERIRQKKESLENEIIAKLKNDRASYWFFKKNILKTNEYKHLEPLYQMIKSEDFEVFYKIFTMKDRKDLCQIKDIGKKEPLLVQTTWFKQKFEALISKIL